MSDFSFTTTCSFCSRRFCPDDGPCECVDSIAYDEEQEDRKYDGEFEEKEELNNGAA
jgi:hypothetical protein